MKPKAFIPAAVAYRVGAPALRSSPGATPNQLNISSAGYAMRLRTYFQRAILGPVPLDSSSFHSLIAIMILRIGLINGQLKPNGLYTPYPDKIQSNMKKLAIAMQTWADLHTDLSTWLSINRTVSCIVGRCSSPRCLNLKEPCKRRIRRAFSRTHIMC